MRTFATLFVSGSVALLILKLLATVFLPVLGVLIGLVVTGFKLVLLAGVVYFVYSMIFKRRKREAEEA